MSVWCLVGRSRVYGWVKEAISVGGLNPWDHQWVSLEEPKLVVLVPSFPSQYLWLGVYEMGDAQRQVEFAACKSDDIWSFYVPASPGTPGSFEAKTVKHEGYWATSQGEASKFPWPIPAPTWLGRTAFLSRLDKLEATAKRVYYSGKSLCRLCGCQNGSQEFRFDDWVWPEGYRHYITDHYVRPSEQFEAFLATAVGSPDGSVPD
jgi:hypothetical protein